MMGTYWGGGSAIGGGAAVHGMGGQQVATPPRSPAVVADPGIGTKRTKAMPSAWSSSLTAPYLRHVQLLSDNMPGRAVPVYQRRLKAYRKPYKTVRRVSEKRIGRVVAKKLRLANELKRVDYYTANTTAANSVAAFALGDTWQRVIFSPTAPTGAGGIFLEPIPPLATQGAADNQRIGDRIIAERFHFRGTLSTGSPAGQCVRFVLVADLDPKGDVPLALDIFDEQREYSAFRWLNRNRFKVMADFCVVVQPGGNTHATASQNNVDFSCPLHGKGVSHFDGTNTRTAATGYALSLWGITANTLAGVSIPAEIAGSARVTYRDP